MVPGGGVALLRSISALDSLKLKDDEAIGVDIVRRALEDPVRQIATNAGLEGAVVVQRVKSEKGSVGFNARTGEYEDLVKAGVIDPTKVVRSALQNASSVAALILTTETLVTEEPEKDKGKGGMPGGHAGMGDMGM